MASQDGGRASIFIDSHAHLADAAFAGDRDAVIARARDAGAAAIVCIGESLETAALAAEYAAQYPGFVFPTAGIHPHDAGDVRRTARHPEAARAPRPPPSRSASAASTTTTTTLRASASARAFAAQIALGGGDEAARRRSHPGGGGRHRAHSSRMRRRPA